MTQETAWDRVKYKVYGLILIVVSLSLIALSLAMYNQQFKEFKKVTLLTDRAGLQMFEGNRVKIDGVDAGQVGSIENLDDGSGVEIELKLFPDMIEKIPANAEVSLEQLTAFGNKAVQMKRPAEPSPEHLRDGDTLDTRNNAVEINNLLQSLADVLEVAEPAKLNAALGNIAQGLEGNGDTLGETVSQAVDYLRKFNVGGKNGDLGNLQRDLRVFSEFSDLYADIAPDLTGALGNLSTTLQTFHEKDDGVDSFLLELAQVGISAGDLFNPKLVGLSRALSSVGPLTDLLGQYSPELTCFLQGADFLEEQALPAFQDQIRLIAGVTWAREGYKPVRDLPEVGVHADQAGPSCYGLPVVEAGEEPLGSGTLDPESMNQAAKDTYANPLIPGTPGIAPGTPLTVQLFGGGAGPGGLFGDPANYPDAPAGGGN